MKKLVVSGPYGGKGWLKPGHRLASCQVVRLLMGPTQPTKVDVRHYVLWMVGIGFEDCPPRCFPVSVSTDRPSMRVDAEEQSDGP